MLFVVLAVSTHAHFGLYIRIICVYAKADCTPIKHMCLCKPKYTSAVCANQKCMCSLRQKMMHTAAELTSCALITTSSIFCAHAGFCASMKRVKSCSCYTRMQSSLN